MSNPIIFIIEIPEEVSGVKEFTGSRAGVDYYKGRGSTSSAQDAKRAQDAGCTITDRDGKPLYIRRYFNAGRSEAFSVHEEPQEDGQRPAEPGLGAYVSKADREQREAKARRLGQ